MNSHKNAQDTWFDQLPNAEDKEAFRLQMLQCFRDKILPENKPESIPECVFEILTKMPEHGMLWELATRR